MHPCITVYTVHVTRYVNLVTTSAEDNGLLVLAVL